MNVDRRAFIKLVAGGVGGTLLSPLPWKLADDTSIWSQNWSWRPSPKRGAASMVNTICQLCAGGCGIRVRLIDGERAVKIEGNPNHPVSQGGICPLGAAGLQLQYGLSRIETPLQQTGRRGELKTLKPLSWDEAVEILTSKVKALRQQPQGLVCLSGRRQGTVAELFSRFLQAYGSPNYLLMPTAADAESLGLLLSQGDGGTVAYDLENAKMIISFGAAFIEGWGAPVRMMKAFQTWRSQPYLGRSRIVQVESRGSMSASKADGWVAVAPGTEAALALGLAQVIVSEGLYDHSFVKWHTYGFQDFRELLFKEYTADKVAAITGVAPKQIVSLAREFARTKPAVALSGRGQGRMPGSLYEFLAVQSLNALVGSLYQPGGVSRTASLPLAPWPQVVLDEPARRGVQAPRLDGAGSPQFPLAEQLVHNFVRNLNRGEPYPARMLWVYEANPAHDLADVQPFLKALEKIETVVSFSPYLDETTQLADLILPGPTYLERLDDMGTPPGLPYPVFGLSRPVLAPRFETRHPGDLLIGLARSLGGSVAASMPWADFETALKARAKGLFAHGSGMVADRPPLQAWRLRPGRSLPRNYGSFAELWEKLKEHGCWFDASPGWPEWSAAFKTPSGRFEFYCQKLHQAGGSNVVCLPHFEVAEPAGDPERYPLLLVPYETLAIVSGPLANPPFLTKMLFDFQLKGNDGFVEINPRTAARAGLKEGAVVSLETERGKIRARLHLSEAAPPGVIFIPVGLGHTAFDFYIKGKGVNANQILVAQQERLSGLASWWGTRARISRT